MAYTQTTELDLDKATPGTNQAFETAVINSNWDKVDAAVAANNTAITAIEGDITTIQDDVTDLQAGTTITTIDGGTA